MHPLFLAPLALILGTAPLAAQTVSDMVFGKGAQCFARSYSADHLARHPEQRVTSILVHADTENMALDWANDLLVRIEVEIRGDPTPYTGIGVCGPVGDAMNCWMEGDAGGFRLSGQNGRLRLDIGEDGLIFEGQADFLMLSATKGDDRVFLMDGGACP